MPLTALHGEIRLVSVDLPSPAFEALRGATDLVMTCCEARAIPKRSVLGLPFFAHHTRGTCEYAGESELHVLAKVEILRAARAAGWVADVEVRGHTPEGQRWRADVLCERGRHRVAFEVQRSGIVLQELHARQALYRASGVRGFWLMRTHERRLRQAQPWQHETPALYLSHDRHIPDLNLNLTSFTRAALGGHLKLFPIPDQPVQLRVVAEPKRCFRCFQNFYLTRAVLVADPEIPTQLVMTPGIHPELGPQLTTLFQTLDLDAGFLVPWPQTAPFVSWPSTAPHTFHCPNCGAARSAARFGKTWLDPAQAATTWARGDVRVWERTLTLPPEYHAWLTQTTGQVWVLRPRTNKP